MILLCNHLVRHVVHHFFPHSWTSLFLERNQIRSDGSSSFRMAARAIGHAPKADGSRCPLGHLAMMWLQEMGVMDTGKTWKNLVVVD